MARSPRTFGEAMNAALPQELADMVKAHVFADGPHANVAIDEASYHPPAILQVNRAYRKLLSKNYYANTTFEVKDAATCIRWLDSLSIEAELEINTIHLGGPPIAPEPVMTVSDAVAAVRCPCVYGEGCRWEEVCDCLVWLREKYFSAPRPGGRASNAARWQDQSFKKQHRAIQTWFCLPGHTEAAPKIEWSYYYRDAIDRIYMAGLDLMFLRMHLRLGQYPELPRGVDEDDDFGALWTGQASSSPDHSNSDISDSLHHASAASNPGD